MFKLIAVLFALVLTMLPAHSSSKAIFKGNYNGIASLETATGDRLFYSPVRFKISNSGQITGTAYNDDTQSLLRVSGSIKKVNSMFGIRFIGKASGTFSDGTKWTAEIEANKGVTAKAIRGKARQGDYSGTLSLTNL